jgi:hypothetical protein
LNYALYFSTQFEISDLFSARALDTTIGCGVAITAPRAAFHQVNAEIRYTISVAQYLTISLAQDNSVSSEALNARRNLHHHTIVLQ